MGHQVSNYLHILQIYEVSVKRAMLLLNVVKVENTGVA